MTKRIYVRPEKVKIVSRKTSKKVDQKPKMGTCWVCFKKRPLTDMVNIGVNRKMCMEHDDAYNLNPLGYTMLHHGNC